jgi:hypothetical protein
MSAVKLEEKGVGKKLLKIIYIKFFGGKIFTATRVVFSTKNSQLALSLPENFTCITKNFEMWCARNFC